MWKFTDGDDDDDDGRTTDSSSELKNLNGRLKITACFQRRENNPFSTSFQEKKEEIRLRPMSKAPILTEKSQKQRDTQKRHQNFDNTTIADRLRTVSRGYNSHPTGVVKPVDGIRTFPLPQR